MEKVEAVDDADLITDMASMEDVPSLSAVGVSPGRAPVGEGMEKEIIVQSSEHAAFLSPSGRVRVYRKSGRDGTLVPVGQAGRWEGGIILGSDVNCGVLAHLEPALRAATGTP